MATSQLQLLAQDRLTLTGRKGPFLQSFGLETFMPVAELTPLIVDPLAEPRAADRASAVVPHTPPPSPQSASTASSVDESSTAAEAGAALSAFLVQMSSGATASSVRSATAADSPPNGSRSFERPLPEAFQMSFPNGSTPPPEETISLFAGPGDAAAPLNTGPVNSAASGPTASATAAEQTSESSSQPSLSSQVGDLFIVDDSSTSADAGAALSAFLVQIRSGSSDVLPSSAFESGGEPNSDRGSDLRSPGATPTSSRIPVRPGSPDISVTQTSSASEASTSGNDAADFTSDAAAMAIGPPAAGLTFEVDRAPVTVPLEAGDAGTAHSPLSLQTRAGLSEAALAPGSDVPGNLEGVDVRLAEAPRALLPTGATPAVEGQPVVIISGARDALFASDDRSAPGASFGATHRTAGVAILAVRPSDPIRVAGRATWTLSGNSTEAEAGTALSALPLSVNSETPPRPASGNGAEPSLNGERGRPSPDESQAPTPASTRVGTVVFDMPVRDAADAAVLGSDLLAAGLLTLVPSLAPTRSPGHGHHPSTSRVTPATPVLASGSATSAHTGSGKGLPKHAQTAFAVEASAAEAEEPSGEAF